MLTTGNTGGFFSQLPVDLAEILFIQKGTPTAVQRKANIPVLIFFHGGSELFPQRSLKAAVQAGRFLIDHHFPFLTAAVGACSRQTAKFSIIIRYSDLHKFPPYSSSSRSKRK
jgi:hypothetical protein